MQKRQWQLSLGKAGRAGLQPRGSSFSPTRCPVPVRHRQPMGCSNAALHRGRREAAGATVRALRAARVPQGLSTQPTPCPPQAQGLQGRGTGRSQR